MERSPQESTTCLHWFCANNLRLSDNPALNKCLQEWKQKGGEMLFAFILDPSFLSPLDSGPSVNVWRFLLECLADLNQQLEQLYGRSLRVFCGDPPLIFTELFRLKQVRVVSYQASQSGYESRLFDEHVKRLCDSARVKLICEYSHTLYTPETIARISEGKLPVSYTAFRQLLPKLGRPENPVQLAEIGTDLKNGSVDIKPEDRLPYEIAMPTLHDLGFEKDDQLYTGCFTGGEQIGLKKLSEFASKRIATKSQEMVTWLTEKDSLSPYIRFGCISTRQVFQQLNKLPNSNKDFMVAMIKNLLLREFAYCVALGTPNFGQMVGNKLCIQLPWDNNNEYTSRFLKATTGFPWIDAIITQTHREGWAHYVARKSLAVFLTRGYLWLSWVFGKNYFQNVMLDFEMPVSCVCWMQDSCSGFFCEKIESLEPVEVGRKMDPKGEYIRQYMPILKDFPDEYVHTPWLAPEDVQRKANCVIGKDYPKPIVDLCTQGKLCCARIEAIMNALQQTYGE